MPIGTEAPRRITPHTLRELLEPYRFRPHSNLWCRPAGLISLLPEREPKSWNWTGYRLDDISAACDHARLTQPEEADIEAEKHMQSFRALKF